MQFLTRAVDPQTYAAWCKRWVPKSELLPVEKSWGPDYLRMGLTLSSTLQGQSNYSLRAAYQKTWLNSLGAELLLTGEVGSDVGVSAEIYQPIDTAQRYFANAIVTVRNESGGLFINDLRVSDYRNHLTGLDVGVGVNLGLVGQARLGRRDERHALDLETGVPVLTTDPIRIRGLLASIELDQRNQLYISTRGWSAKGNWFDSEKGEYGRLPVNWNALVLQLPTLRLVDEM